MACDVVLGCTSDNCSIGRRGGSFGFIGFKRVPLLLLVAAMVLGSFGCFGWSEGTLFPRPRPGVARFFEDLMVSVPGGRVNASGGNLFVTRADLSVDTRIGAWEVMAVWNSSAGVWHWNFASNLFRKQSTMKPIYTDDTGYQFNLLMGTGIGGPVSGSHWVWHAENAVRTSGGLVYEFNEAGMLASVHWISAEYPALRFVRNGNATSSPLVSIDQCTSETECSTVYTMTYDSAGRLVAVEDLAGRFARYTYEGDSKRITSARDAHDIANGWPGTRYEYDETGRLVAIANSHDERVEYRYAGTTLSILEVEQIGEGDPLWQFSYTAMGKWGFAITEVFDPMGGASRYTFDLSLRLWNKINPDGEAWKWKWSGYSYDRTLEISPWGSTREFEVVNRDVATETQPSGNVITRTYATSPAENRARPYERAITKIEDDLGLIESRTYTSAGVLESITTGSGNLTTFAYDGSGDLTISEPAGLVTTYSDRGDHGHFGSVTRGSTTVIYTYDVLGNLLEADGLFDNDPSIGSFSIGQGGIVSRSYDPDRNIATITLEDGGAAAEGLQTQLQIGWRTDHQRLRIQRPYGGDTEFRYDALGRSVEEKGMVDGSWASTLIEYDANGRTTAVLKPNGMATRMTYRGSGEITSVRHERDWTDADEVSSVAVLGYEAGRLIAIRDSAHGLLPEEYYYDGEGLLAEIRYPDGEFLTFGHDLRGRVDLKQYWRSDATLLRTFEYDYDLANQRVAVREDGMTILDLDLQAGRVAEAVYGNGVAVVYSYDGITGAFNGFTATNEGQEIVAQMEAFDAVCDIVLPASRCKIENALSHIGVLAASHAKYQLEDQRSERLIADTHGAWVAVDEYYDYDELSNVESSSVGDFIYNPERNRLLAIEDGDGLVVEYAYDEAGYVTSRNGVPITWNGMGRVIAVGSGMAMGWDTFGRKTSATVAGTETHWRYGGELVEDEFGGNQKLDLGWVVCALDDSTHQYRLFDFRGNSKLMLDDAGEVTVHHHYSGYERVSSNGSDQSGMGFAAGTHVDELVVMGERVYDPVARRFLSRDPILQTINQYSYTLGNPVRFWDSDGAQAAAVPPPGYALETTKSGFRAGVNFVVVHSEVHHEVTTTVLVPIPDAPDSPALDSSGTSNESRRTGNGTCKANCSKGSGVPGSASGPSGGSGPNLSVLCGLGFEIAPLLLILYWLKLRCVAKAVFIPPISFELGGK